MFTFTAITAVVLLSNVTYGVACGAIVRSARTAISLIVQKCMVTNT